MRTPTKPMLKFYMVHISDLQGLSQAEVGLRFGKKMRFPKTCLKRFANNQIDLGKTKTPTAKRRHASTRTAQAQRLVYGRKELIQAQTLSRNVQCLRFLQIRLLQRSSHNVENHHEVVWQRVRPQVDDQMLGEVSHLTRANTVVVTMT